MSSITNSIQKGPVSCTDDCGRQYDFKLNESGEISVRVYLGFKEISVVTQENIFFQKFSESFTSPKSSNTLLSDEKIEFFEAFRTVVNTTGISKNVFQAQLEYGKYTKVNAHSESMYPTVKKIWIVVPWTAAVHK